MPSGSWEAPDEAAEGPAGPGFPACKEGQMAAGRGQSVGYQLPLWGW